MCLPAPYASVSVAIEFLTTFATLGSRNRIPRHPRNTLRYTTKHRHRTAALPRVASTPLQRHATHHTAVTIASLATHATPSAIQPSIATEPLPYLGVLRRLFNDTPRTTRQSQSHPSPLTQYSPQVLCSTSGSLHAINSLSYFWFASTPLQRHATHHTAVTIEFITTHATPTAGSLFYLGVDSHNTPQNNPEVELRRLVIECANPKLN